MKVGHLKEAKRIALNRLDEWNDVTGFVEKHSGYYYELQSLIEESVHIGAQMALFGQVSFGEDGSLLHEHPDLSGQKNQKQ